MMGPDDLCLAGREVEAEVAYGVGAAPRSHQPAARSNKGTAGEQCNNMIRLWGGDGPAPGRRLAPPSQRPSLRRKPGAVDYKEKKINIKERRGSPRLADGGGGVADKADPKSKAAGVDPPPSELVDRLHSLPVEQLRTKLREGMRVKVRFVEEIDGPYGGGAKGGNSKDAQGGKGGNGKKGGKRKEIKWYPGAIAKILSGGRKIKIGYDDGTEETAAFPDRDIFVEGLGELLELGGEGKGASHAKEGGAAEDGANNPPKSPAVSAEPCEELGAGWTKRTVPRKNASGRWGNAKNDTFYFGPGGTKFKSMAEARRHLEEGAGVSNGRDEGVEGGVGAVEGAAGGGGGKQPAPASTGATAVDGDSEKAGGDKMAVADAGKDKGSLVGKEGRASSSAIGEEQPEEISNDKPQSAHPEPKPPQCVPFNRALKAALDSYHNSHTLVKIQNDPKGPAPPPFLSHDEECAVKTALALVMARKRVQGREGKRVENEGGEGGTSSFLAAGMGRQSIQTQRKGGRPSSLLGGLLSAPMRSMTTVAAGNSSSLATDRKLHHVRDVLRLAVSAALPLYRGALEGGNGAAAGNDEGAGSVGRRPCAVYDYEAAVQPASHHGGSEGSDRGHASLDELCRHAVERLAGLLREEALRAKNCRRAAVPEKAREGAEDTDENRSDGNGCSSNNGCEGPSEELGLETSRSSTGRGVGGGSVRDAIARLVQDDLLGKAFSYGTESSNSSSKRGRSQSNNARESAERRVERVMAVCHVLHRLLFVDEGCCLGTEVVSAICSVLGDLYSNQYRSRTASNDDGSERGSANGIDGESRSASSRSSEELRKSQSEKHQLIPSRWTVGAGSYVHDRHERRLQAVDVLSQRSGAKRVHPHEEDVQQNSLSSNAALPLPRIGDVLAVNLLRLLEGAAAIRLHHRQQRARGGRGDRDRALDRAASAAAAEVLGEIRAGFVGEGREVLLPVQGEDAAAFYFSEKRALEGANGGKAALLLPGAKMMLRLHLFGLTSKLALYEQA